MRFSFFEKPTKPAEPISIPKDVTDRSKKAGHLTSGLEALLNGTNSVSDTEQPDGAGHKIPIRKINDFSQIPEGEKHPDLEPVVGVVDHVKVIPNEEKTPQTKKLVIPQPLLEYIDELIAEGKPLKYFKEMELGETTSIQDAIDHINFRLSKKIINKEESNKMIGLLKGAKFEEKPELSDDELIELSLSEFDKDPENFKKSLEYLDKIKDPKVRSKGYIDFCSDLVVAGRFDLARNLSDKVEDLDQKKFLLGFIDSKEKSPKTNELKEEPKPEPVVGENSDDVVDEESLDELFDFFTTSGGRVKVVDFIESRGVRSSLISKEIVGEFIKVFDALVSEGEIKKIRGEGLNAEYELIEKETEPATEPEIEIPPVAQAVEVEPLKQTDPTPVQTPESANAPVDLSPEEQAQKEKEEAGRIEAELTSARSEYAQELIAWKNKNHERKNWWRKIQEDLGFIGHEKKMPEVEKANLLEAEKKYIEAKRKKAEGLFNKSVEKERVKGKDSLFGGEKYIFNEKLLEQAEKEYENLHKMVLKGTPEKEAGRFRKALAKFNEKVPPPVRIAALASLLGVGVGIFAGVGVYGAATYAGYRAVKGLGALGVSKGAGIVADKYFENKNEKSKEEIFVQYAENITPENFVEKQEELARALAEQENLKKRQILKKAGVMAATGGVAAAVLGGVWKPSVSNMTDSISKPSAKDLDNIAGKKPSGAPNVAEQINKVKPNAPVPESAPSIKPTSVELSEKGFIQTFEDMKSKLVSQYGGVDKVPKQYEHFVKTPSTKLAQEFGFYKPGQELESGMGMKGDTLNLNAKGQLEYHDIHGKTSVIDAEHKFAGKMLDTDKPQSDMTPPRINQEVDLSKTDSLHEDIQPEIQIPPEPVDTSNGADHTESYGWEVNEHPAGTAPEATAPENPVKVKLDEIGGKKINLELTPNNDGVLTMEGVGQIAHKTPFGSNEIFVLEDKFQDGEEFKSVREAFNKGSDQTLSANKFAKIVLPVPFEGGKIQIVHGTDNLSNQVKILLNGKEIAKGMVGENGGVAILDKSLKPSWWQAENVYERALKHANPLIKTLRKVIDPVTPPPPEPPKM